MTPWTFLAVVWLLSPVWVALGYAAYSFTHPERVEYATITDDGDDMAAVRDNTMWDRLDDFALWAEIEATS